MRYLKPHFLLTNGSAGLVAGLVTVTYSISYATLIFSGDLAASLPLGISMALLGAFMLGVGIACTSSLPFVIAAPDSNASALLAVMATAIAQELQAQGQTEQIPVTVVAAIVISTILTGILLFVLGRLQFGRFIRFIPYPVLGGFLAIVGLLLTQGSFQVMTDHALTFSNLSLLLGRSQIVLWLPGVVLALGIRFILPRYKQFWVLPLILLGTTALIHGGLRLGGIDLTEAIARGWLFAPFPSTNPLQVWQTLSWQQIAWESLFHQVGSFVTLFAVVAITILLCATSIEMASEQDMDLDRELCAAGLVNVATGLAGGMIGHLSVSRSLLNRAAGATHPLAGIVAASFCGGMALFGDRLLAYLPRAVLGGLLLYLGLSLLIEWLYEAWFNLSRLDYTLVVSIVLAGAKWGFLVGVAVGLTIACFMFAINYSRLRVIRNTLSGEVYRSTVKRSVHEQKRLREQGHELWICLIQGYLFFGTAYTLLNLIRQRLQESAALPIRFVVLDFRLVAGLDSSAINSFVKLKQITQAHNVCLVLTNLSPTIRQRLSGKDNVIHPDEPTNKSTVQVFSDLDRGVEWCEMQILEESQLRRKRFVPLAIQLEDFFLETTHIRPFMKYLKRCKLAAGDLLFQQGEQADAMYFLESGQISVFLTPKEGQTQRLQTINSGTVVGELGFYRQAPHQASGVADQPSRLYKLSKSALQQMQTESPALVAALHESIARLLAEQFTQSTAGMNKLLQ